MGFGQIGLKPERFIRRRPRFLGAGSDRFDGVITPALQMRQTRVRQCERRIELNRLLVERLDPRQVIVMTIRPVENFFRLEVNKIGLAVFRRLLLDPLLFVGRQCCLQRRSNFLCQLALDREHVGQFAIVNLRPQMPVVRRIDQLDIDANAFAIAPDTRLQDRGHVQGLSDFAQVVRLPAIRHHGCARDHFEVADPGEVCQHVVLDAVGEVGVLLIDAGVVERQDRDRFLQLARGSAGNEKVAGGIAVSNPNAASAKIFFRPAANAGGQSAGTVSGVAVIPASLTSKAQRE